MREKKYLSKKMLHLLRRFSTKSASVPKTKLYINGEFIDSQTDKWFELRNPVRMATPCAFIVLIHKTYLLNLRLHFSFLSFDFSINDRQLKSSSRWFLKLLEKNWIMQLKFLRMRSKHGENQASSLGKRSCSIFNF